jgi:hypothetical protein
MGVRVRLLGSVGLLACAGVLAACSSGGASAGGPSPTPTAGVATPSASPTIDALVAGTDRPPTPGSPQAQVAALATEFATSHDAARRCLDLLDGPLVDRIGALVSDTRQACARNLAEADREGFPTGLQIRELRVAPDGTGATATVMLEGGALEGTTGHWMFARISGFGRTMHTDPAGHWALVDWKTDYLRSYDQNVLGPGYVAAGPGDPLADAKVRDCTNHALQSLSDQDFTGRFYQQFTYADDRRYGIELGCVHVQAPTDTARLRVGYEFELIETLIHTGNSAAVAHCAVERVLGGMDDSTMARAALDDSGGAAIRKSLGDVVGGCGGTPPTSGL